MEITGITKLINRKLTEVSSCELQRAGICRALINTPLILFGDEPTGGLNSKTTEEIISLLNDINKSGMAIMLVTHDAKVAHQSDRVLFMEDGQIVSEKVLKGMSEDEKTDVVLKQMRDIGI